MTDSFEAQRGLLGLAKITPAFDLDAPVASDGTITLRDSGPDKRSLY
jgi:hypothetical protein